MTSWYIIDSRGARPLPGSPAISMQDWPAFAMLSAKVPLEQLEQTLDALLERAELFDAHDDTHPLYLHSHEGTWTIATERDLDPDACVLRPELAALLSEQLHARLAFLSHDLATGAILFDLYESGELTMRWEDALDPALPSEVTLFSESGRCTREDARRYALRALDLPAHTPILDRHAFIELMLARAGLLASVAQATCPEAQQCATLHVRDLNAC